MNHLDKFKNIYHEIYKEIDQELDKFNKSIINDDIDIVKNNMELFANLNSGGKLIRGFLINLGYKLIKGEYNYSIPLSVAYEVFQTSILVHDDIIDHDSLRRGEKTIHYANLEEFNKNVDNNNFENRDISSSLALCSGDLGLFYANNIIAKNYKNDRNLGEVLELYNKIVIDTIRGEMLDVYLPFSEKHHLRKSSTLDDDIMKIYELKTAWYTIIGPLLLGMTLAEADKEKLNDIKNFSYNLGIAFQIQDDILGIFADGKNLGKVIGSDIKEFKQTILYSYVINTEYKEKFLRYYGKENLEDEDILEVADIIIKSGSLDYAKTKLDELFDESIKILNNIDWLNQDDKDILYGFIEFLDKRDK